MENSIEARDAALYEGPATARLENFGAVSPDDKRSLAELAGPPTEFKRGDIIRSDRDASTCLHLLLDGWAASAITMEDGSRQLTSVSLPGDILGMPTLAVSYPLDTIVALDSVRACVIPAKPFMELLMDRPRLAAVLFLISQEERMFAMERLALMGRAPARDRLAALFVRLRERCSQLSNVSADRFPMPLRQSDIGDLIGTSTVHTNRILKNFRELNLAVIKKRELEILDNDRLLARAGVSAWHRAEPSWL
ncbi:Crp/Fnr family transcriptional regulator [Qipengyuania sp. MTN3-11]|uniref:Crp/Fnr family transcriptional regulator n=1 Tax=Qipengyuania sp. MTN3-11 TaxID=3056557 RepID=UPI0036F27F1D